jgi:hypothetical protein
MKPLFTLIGLIVIMTSCEYAYDYSYSVTNKTDTQIKVYAKTFLIDSAFNISKDSTKTLFIGDHGIEGSKGPYFENVTVDLDNFTVTKNDTLTSSKDYLKNESWTFKKGDYSTIVTNEEF